MLRALSLEHKLKEVDSLSAVDYMDNGAAIALNITINRAEGSAVFDFTGTDPQIYGTNHQNPSSFPLGSSTVPAQEISMHPHQ